MSSKIFTGTRVILGLFFLIFGANGLLMIMTGSGFIPMPPPKPEILEKMVGFFNIGYLMPLVKSLQIVAGLLLLSGFFVNLALVILGPIILNIVCVHAFIDISGLPMALFITALYFVLLMFRWNDFKALLKI